MPNINITGASGGAEGGGREFFGTKDERQEAAYQNRDSDMRMDQLRKLADRENYVFDARMRNERMLADYMDRAFDDRMRNERALAEYSNRRMDAEDNQARKLAEYTNTQKKAEYDQTYREAQYEKRDRDMRDRERQRRDREEMQNARTLAKAEDDVFNKRKRFAATMNPENYVNQSIGRIGHRAEHAAANGEVFEVWQARRRLGRVERNAWDEMRTASPERQRELFGRIHSVNHARAQIAGGEEAAGVMSIAGGATEGALGVAAAVAVVAAAAVKAFAQSPMTLARFRAWRVLVESGFPNRV